ncbi:MAG: hypothetical protein PHQ36_11995, partial [Anaerolineales bacterium]|nr:hypothetical protein [Anaerolineales bacterium]
GGETVKLEARVGLDGVCKSGAWIPVRVTVENIGGGFDARVQASYKNDQGGQSVYAADISLPAASRKEFFLYVAPTSSVRDFRVSVFDGKTLRAQKKMNVSCAADRDLLFGILADDPAPYSVLNDIRPLSGGRSRLAYLTVLDLPDRAQGWSALDALVVSNVDTGQLSAGQKQALELWIANGGKLFVVGGVNWMTASVGLRDILPVEITSTKRIAGLSELSAYVKDSAPLAQDAILAVGNNREGARVLVAQYAVPLLIEKQIGYGKVYYFAADPALQPLSDWDGVKIMYEHLLAFKSNKPSWTNAAWDSYQASRAISALPQLNLPSFLYIFCWLGVYILAIGPVNYLILRRMKRAELAWITVPVLVVLFSCLAYAFGFAYRGVKPILNRLTLAQGWDDASSARVNSLTGIYSPSRTTYNIQTQDQFMLYQIPSMDSGLQGNDNWLSLKNESGTALPDVRVEIGGVRSVGAEGAMPALNIQSDLILTVSRNGYNLTGKITNASGHTLRDAALIFPNDWSLLGDFKPNETKTINRSISAAAMPPTDMYQLTQKLGMPPYPSSTDDNVSIRRSSFFQASVIPDNGLAPMVSGVYLMGWVDDIPAPVTLQDWDSDAVDTMLYFHKFAPGMATSSGTFALSSSMYDWESSIGALATQIPSGGYEVRFQPSQPINFSAVESLTLGIQSGAPGKEIVWLWNFEMNAWDLISLQAFAAPTDIPQAARYVGADGELRIKLDASQNDYVQVGSVDFSLTVKP